MQRPRTSFKKGVHKKQKKITDDYVKVAKNPTPKLEAETKRLMKTTLTDKVPPLIKTAPPALQTDLRLQQKIAQHCLLTLSEIQTNNLNNEIINKNLQKLSNNN